MYDSNCIKTSCEASIDYKYEWNKLLKENEELKKNIILYKNIVKELGILLNLNIYIIS